MTTPKTPLGEHLAAVVRKRLGSLRENADSVLSTDSVDAVHDVRVASRRLRAFLDVFRPAMDPSVHTAAKKALRKLSRAMGPLRDADVLALAVAEHGARAGSDLDKASVDLIRVHLHGLREEARESGRKKLRKIDLRDVEDAIRAALDSALSHLPEDPLGTSLFALSLLSPFVVKMQDAAEHAASERAEDLHELRIRAKRVRYAVELLQPCLGEAYRALHEQIQAVQETLGAHHDAHVLRTLVDERLGLLRDSGAETLTVGVARYRNVLTDAEENALLAFDHLGFDAVSFRTRLEAALIGA